jgi:PAS domain-containing protein
VIREQAATIAELSVETERLRAAIEILKEGVSICDGDGRLALSTRRFAAIYRLGAADVQRGRSGSRAGAPAAGRPIRARAGRPRPDAQRRRETARLDCRPPGWMLCRDPRGARARRGWVSAHRDVTVIHECGALVKERLSLQKLVDLVPDNLWLKDAGSCFLIANDATARQIGLPSSADLIGRTDFELHPRETAEKYFVDERRIVESGEPMIDCEE